MSTFYGVILSGDGSRIINNIDEEDLIDMRSRISPDDISYDYIDENGDIKYIMVPVAKSNGFCLNDLVRFLPEDTIIYSFDDDCESLNMEQLKKLINEW